MPWKTKSHYQRERERHGLRAERRLYDQGRRKDDPALAKAKQIRSSARWQLFRKWFLRHEPLCRDPFGFHQTDGQSVSAAQVHHITPVGERPQDAFKAFNCVSLCVVCHAKVEGMERAGAPTAHLFPASDVPGKAEG